MKSIALYARVSSERQMRQATIESQLAALRARASEDGCVVLPSDEYLDNGHSGSTLRRPALERLRDRAAQGTLDVIYVHSPDRLARRYAHQVLLLEELASHDVRVVMLDGRNGESAEDQLLVQVQGVIAEYERAKILERSRRGKLHKARTGAVSVLSQAPYGYRYIKKSADGAPAHYQIVLHEARVVRQIFEAVVKEQQTLYAVSRRLNQEGVPSRGAAKPGNSPRWRPNAVRAVLYNPSYMGQAAFGKTQFVERSGSLRPIIGRSVVPKKAKSGMISRPPEEWIRIPVPALVSEEIHTAAQVQLERNRKFASRNRKLERYLLSGLVVCAVCGYGFYGKTVIYSGRHASNAYYSCGASGRGEKNMIVSAKTKCSNRSVRTDLLDEHAWQAVCALLKDPARVMQEWMQRADSCLAQSNHDRQLEEARHAIRGHERTLQRLVDAYEAGVLDLAALTSRSERIRTRMTQAAKELATLEKVLIEKRELQLVVARVEDFAHRLHKGLDTLSWQERQAIVRTVVARIEVNSDEAAIVYRVPAAALQSPEASLLSSQPVGVGCDLGVKIP